MSINYLIFYVRNIIAAKHLKCHSKKESILFISQIVVISGWALGYMFLVGYLDFIAWNTLSELFSLGLPRLNIWIFMGLELFILSCLSYFITSKKYIFREQKEMRHTVYVMTKMTKNDDATKPKDIFLLYGFLLLLILVSFILFVVFYFILSLIGYAFLSIFLGTVTLLDGFAIFWLVANVIRTFVPDLRFVIKDKTTQFVKSKFRQKNEVFVQELKSLLGDVLIGVENYDDFKILGTENKIQLEELVKKSDVDDKIKKKLAKQVFKSYIPYSRYTLPRLRTDIFFYINKTFQIYWNNEWTTGSYVKLSELIEEGMVNIELANGDVITLCKHSHATVGDYEFKDLKRSYSDYYKIWIANSDDPNFPLETFQNVFKK